MSWDFIVVTVPQPILGADLRALFKLVPYSHQSKLLDSLTGLGVRSFWQRALVFGLSLIDKSYRYSKILAEYPELTSNSPIIDTLVDDVKHYIITNGPPLAQRARRLPTDKLAAGKQIFLDFLDLGQRHLIKH